MSSILVLGTDHRLQGAEKRTNNIDDPSYRKLVSDLISWHDVSFVFEEACGFDSTDAKKIAKSESIDYADIDLSEDERSKLGLIVRSGEEFAIDSNRPKDRGVKENLEAHHQREKRWLEEIKKQKFDSALVICGCLHLLGFARRLQDSGFSIAETVCYVPYHKLVGSAKSQG